MRADNDHSARRLGHVGHGIVQALEYVPEKLNDNPKLLRVYGGDLRVGYEFDGEMFACGQSPLCTDVNRLVQPGVVLVTRQSTPGTRP